MPDPQPSNRSATSFLKLALKKAITLVVVGIVFGWFYAWASPWAFPREPRAGFGRGVLHGALMPMALPSLVIGKDVEIYGANNSGRSYKLGYIVGINLCGLLFFGSAFWRPARKPSFTKGEADAPAQKHQLR